MVFHFFITYVTYLGSFSSSWFLSLFLVMSMSLGSVSPSHCVLTLDHIMFPHLEYNVLGSNDLRCCFIIHLEVPIWLIKVVFSLAISSIWETFPLKRLTQFCILKNWRYVILIRRCIWLALPWEDIKVTLWIVEYLNLVLPVNMFWMMWSLWFSFDCCFKSHVGRMVQFDDFRLFFYSFLHADVLKLFWYRIWRNCCKHCQVTSYSSDLFLVFACAFIKLILKSYFLNYYSTKSL